MGSLAQAAQLFLPPFSSGLPSMRNPLLQSTSPPSLPPSPSDPQPTKLCVGPMPLAVAACVQESVESVGSSECCAVCQHQRAPEQRVLCRVSA
eukprot:1492148-Rhodomonas_salina.1